MDGYTAQHHNFDVGLKMHFSGLVISDFTVVNCSIEGSANEVCVTFWKQHYPIYAHCLALEYKLD